MLRSEDIRTDIKLLGRTERERPLEILLAALYVFYKNGRDEVSLAELQESIAEFQQKYKSMGYTFSERFLISSDLLYDLKDLDYRGYIRDYHYRLDSLLPKRFLSLTALGRGLGNKFVQTLTDDAVRDLTNAVKMAMDNYHKRWRLWARETS